MARRKHKGGRRSKNRERGGRLSKGEKDAKLADSMAKLHELFIKMDEQFKGRTIAGVALDSNSGAVCIHVEEHNKVLMFYATDFSIAEHAGKLRDMLLAAGFLVPEPIMETWNQDFTDMATAYAKAVMAGEDVNPEEVDAERIKLILGSYYNPDEAHEELEKLTGKDEKDVAAGADDYDKALDAESEPEQSDAVRDYLRLKTEMDEEVEASSGAVSDKLSDAVRDAWHAMSGEERAGLRTNEQAPEESVEA